ncbi:ABC transporter ATP-binding protein [Anaerocolumna sp.]|uniref:ABC transporter ATP-binding protein n=1 Tax=Anaerocolumna sp. TaxID=2041569 RepID=UPI0028B0CF5D|nr:ABC transporter ATP-binding protein [Anaerocolumna sp.]
MITYLKPYRGSMLYGLFIKVIGTFLDLGLPWVLAYIIDEVIPYKKISYILLWGLVMILLSVGARTFNIKANRNASKVAKDAVKALRHDLYKKIQSLSGAQIDYFTIPSLGSRLTSDTYNIHSMISMMQRLGVRSPILLIGGIIITSTLEPVLTLVLAGIFPFLVLVVFYISKKGIPLYIQVQSSADRLVRVVRENISGIRVIKALSKTPYEKERFKKMNTEVVDKELKAGMTMAITDPMMNLLLNLGLTLVVVIGAYRVNSGSSEPGKIVAFLSYFTLMLNAVIGITRIFVIYSKASASAARIEEVLVVEDDLKEMDIEPVQTKYHIEFRGVSFSYTKEPCIEDISFGLKRGESLGIIGSTGSGKTTLINLLMRFYDVSQGRILINGRDVKSYNKQELRKKFGVAFQNDVLFADTIYENIKLGRELSREQVKAALIHAQADSFVQELEGELDFKLAIKGSNLSGGQKQRLLIARALAGNPEILILDDSSSALDYKTDSLLRKAIREQYSDTTSIIIAQRISSIMKLDHIFVIEEGKMAGYGTHETLLETCEVYQEIYHSQMM